jgi:hypothetical protein
MLHCELCLLLTSVAGVHNSTYALVTILLYLIKNGGYNIDGVLIVVDV